MPADVRRTPLWIMAAYGFVAGLPLPLTTSTFRLWLRVDGVSLALIGLTTTISVAYALKFLWAPVLDNAAPPGPLRRLGRRRGWLAAIQPALAAAAALLALSDPAHMALLSLALAALVAFLSASQDIVVDAWRIEVFPQHRQGAAMAAYVWGYRIALLIATTGVIFAVGAVGWHAALLGVAALIGLGLVVTLVAPEPPAAERRDRPAGLSARLAHAVIEPLRDFLTRRGALLILAFVALFKLGEAMAGIMTAPFYRASRASPARRSRRPAGSRWAARWPASHWAAGWWRASAPGGRCCAPVGRRRSPWRCICCSPFRRASTTCCMRR